MLKIVIPKQELWDETNDQFVTINETSLALEHSLVSISKWEAKYHKPYFSNNPNEQKTKEEILDYVRCMTLTQNVDDSVYNYLTQDNIQAITKYIEDPMTATTFSNADTKPGRSKNITSELIYYWMISAGVPVEFQKWHLNRLLTLLKICDVYNSKSSGKKIPKNELMARNAALNAARRKKFNTTG